MVVVLLALAAALFFALGTVLQQKAAVDEPDDAALQAGLLFRLAKRPVWLVGIAADGLGFLCQAAALGLGRLVVVQPLLATTVVFALPLGARLTGQRVGRREVLAAIAVTAGLGAFLVISDPSEGKQDATARAWMIAAAIAAIATVALVMAGLHRRPGLKAALLGAAAGILFGLSAALTKSTVDSLGEGLAPLVTDWHLYALIVVGFVSMTLSQASLQTGALAPAVATQMTLDPLASVLMGTLMFDETIHDDALGLVASLAALAVMLGGLVALAARRGETEAEARAGR